jgi:hypothetical protein
MSAEPTTKEHDMNATEKQIDFILSLASRVQDSRARFLSEVDAVWMSQRDRQGKMTKERASEIIDDLKSQLKNR